MSQTTFLMRSKLLLFLCLVLSTSLLGQVDLLDSGGPLMPEQAAYDVNFYELQLQIFPEKQTIAGDLMVRATIVHPTAVFVLDLDPVLAVEATKMSDGSSLSFERRGSKLWIHLLGTQQRGTQIEVVVSYGGKPRVAPNPPWDGGFSWEKTPSGADWIATSCQTQGADIWWPNKDHVSDEPDSMALHIRVPDPLMVAANGRFQRKETHSDATSSYHWYISTPINTYNVALNIAPYVLLKEGFKSISGEIVPVEFYVLPEDESKGEKLMPEILEHLAFYEKYLGPYPFRKDKYGVAQTPHLGMEHQTIIAYGANFNNGSMTGGKDWGFDALHHHELGHEWWGNLVTNYDWKDMWIHEGFCSYMQAVYMEELEGKKGYHAYMDNMRRFPNKLAVSPEESTSAKNIYRAPIYSKGAWILHSLRYLIGEEAFLSSLRKMCYPHPALESVTDGRQCRFVTTADYQRICEQESGQDLSWFFALYLRQAALPTLISRVEGNHITLRWETPDNLPFQMPVDLKLGNTRKRVNVTHKAQKFPFPKGVKPEVDPDKWILMEVK